MSRHVEERLRELRKPKPPKLPRPRRPRTTRIKVPQSDADVLRFIANRLHNLGLPNFAAELDRIADTASPPKPEPEVHEE